MNNKILAMLDEMEKEFLNKEELADEEKNFKKMNHLFWQRLTIRLVRQRIKKIIEEP